jgi:hypothetical protein
MTGKAVIVISVTSLQPACDRLPMLSGMAQFFRHKAKVAMQ